MIKKNLHIFAATLLGLFMLVGSGGGSDVVEAVNTGTSDVNITDQKSPTLTTPAIVYKNTSSTVTVPTLKDTSKLKYSISVTGEASGVQLAQNFDPDTADYDLNALAAGQTITLKVKAPDTAKVTVNGTPVRPNQNCALKIADISIDNNITVTVKLSGEKQKKYTIHTYNRSLPTLNYTASVKSSLQDGIYTFVLNQYMIRMNTAGQVIYYRSLAFLNKTQTVNINFKPVEYADGTKRFTYNVVLDDTLGASGYANGMCVVMDENYKDIESIHLMENSWHSEGFVDDHDLILLSDTHWICESYVKRNVDNIPDEISSRNGMGNVVAGIIQEVDDGKVIMEFDTADYPFFYQTSKRNNDFTSSGYQDYVHINSLFIDPKDNNLIVSMRNQDAVYKIDRTTGKIIWVLGGTFDQFHLTSSQQFVAQHAAYLTKSGALILYNDNTGAGQSSVMEFSLDEPVKTVKTFKQYNLSNYYGDYCGSAFETDSGTHVIDWGLCTKNTSPIFTEFDPKSGEILSTLFSKATSRSSQYIYSYRTYKTSY